MRTFFFSLLIIFTAQQIHASCCSSSSASGVGRLLRHERASVEIGSSYNFLMGVHNEAGSFQKSLNPNRKTQSLTPDFLLLTRAHKYVEPFLIMPFRMDRVKNEFQDATVSPQVGVQSVVLKDQEHVYLPGIILLSSLSMATTFSRTSPINDTIYWTNGITTEKTFGPITYGLSYAMRYPFFLKDPAMKEGHKHDIGVSLGHMINPFHFISGSITQSFTSNKKFENKTLENSWQQKLSFSTAYAYKMHSHVTLKTSLGLDAPINYLGKNIGSEFFMRIGLRLGVF